MFWQEGASSEFGYQKAVSEKVTFKLIPKERVGCARGKEDVRRVRKEKRSRRDRGEAHKKTWQGEAGRTVADGYCIIFELGAAKRRGWSFLSLFPICGSVHYTAKAFPKSIPFTPPHCPSPEQLLELLWFHLGTPTIHSSCSSQGEHRRDPLKKHRDERVCSS